MKVSVDNLAAALAHVEKIRARTQDFRPFWARLAAGPLPELMKARWDARFGLSLTHADETVQQRRNRDHGTYYGDHAPNARASGAHPYFEWTGSLREAASGFTTADRLRAAIDPSVNYRGPLRAEGGWDATGARFLPDAAIYPPAEVERMVETALEKWVADEVAQP